MSAVAHDTVVISCHRSLFGIEGLVPRRSTGQCVCILGKDWIFPIFVEKRLIEVGLGQSLHVTREDLQSAHEWSDPNVGQAGLFTVPERSSSLLDSLLE